MVFIEKLPKLNQIVRCPGIYLEKNKKEDSSTCTIIPFIGSWITLKLDLCIKNLN
jgi:hypothetical protein